MHVTFDKKSMYMYIVCVGGMGSLTVTPLCWMCDHLEQLEWNISGMWSVYRINHSGYREFYSTIKSPILQVAVPFLESIKHNKVMKEELYIMNLGQLQVLVEDLHTQIESRSTGQARSRSFMDFEKNCKLSKKKIT